MENLSGKIILPGSEKQLEHLESKIEIPGKDVLIIGTGSEEIAVYLKIRSAASVKIIASDYESVMNSRMILPKETEISVSMMDFEHTDFTARSFDLIYAQASVTSYSRNKIIKEIKRILKTDGFFCTGEITCLKSPAPVFIKEMWDAGDILPLESNEITAYYEERKFKIIDEKNLSHTLTDYYQKNHKLLKAKLPMLTESEKSYYKIILNRLSHESNVYLKQGGKDYIGFTSIIMRKEI
ncbi:MAG: methyltransferase domain-containing protein [Ignavibacteriaceae bacterium]|nr:methyltransferase domain-containing protein [Ignavibacteriaceae bacterium]